jgi:hypothetical protein
MPNFRIRPPTAIAIATGSGSVSGVTRRSRTRRKRGEPSLLRAEFSRKKDTVLQSLARMEVLLDDPGPYIYAITRTGTRKVA